MKKSLTAAMAALPFGGAVVATAAPAEAQRYDHHGYYGGGYDGGRYYDRGRHHDGHGDALAAGVVGLALGAALASSNNHNNYRGGYGYGYYDEPYYYRHRSYVCES